MTEDGLARALAEVGREVRDAVLSVTTTAADGDVVREAGGDVVFGLDLHWDIGPDPRGLEVDDVHVVGHVLPV